MRSGAQRAERAHRLFSHLFSAMTQAVVVHPVVLLSMADHFTRISCGAGASGGAAASAAAAGRPSFAAGILFGGSAGAGVEATLAAELKVTASGGLDVGYLTRQRELTSAVFPALKVVGWYIVAPSLHAVPAALHDAVGSHTGAALALHLDPGHAVDASGSVVPVAAYAWVAGAGLGARLPPAAVALGRAPAERLVVDDLCASFRSELLAASGQGHVAAGPGASGAAAAGEAQHAGGAPAKDSAAASGSEGLALTEEGPSGAASSTRSGRQLQKVLGDVEASVAAMAARLATLRSYVAAVAGGLPGVHVDHALLRQINALLASAAAGQQVAASSLTAPFCDSAHALELLASMGAALKGLEAMDTTGLFGTPAAAGEGGDELHDGRMPDLRDLMGSSERRGDRERDRDREREGRRGMGGFERSRVRAGR